MQDRCRRKRRGRDHRNVDGRTLLRRGPDGRGWRSGHRRLGRLLPEGTAVKSPVGMRGRSDDWCWPQSTAGTTRVMCGSWAFRRSCAPRRGCRRPRCQRDLCSRPACHSGSATRGLDWRGIAEAQAPLLLQILLVVVAIGYAALVLAASVATSCRAGRVAFWRRTGVLGLFGVLIIGAQWSRNEAGLTGTRAARAVLERQGPPPGSRWLRGLDVRSVTLRASGTVDCSSSEGVRVTGVMLGADGDELSLLIPPPGGGSTLMRVGKGDSVICQDETLPPGGAAP